MRQLFFEELNPNDRTAWIDYRVHWAGSAEEGYGVIVSEDQRVIDRHGETEHRRWFDCVLGYDLTAGRGGN